MTQRQSARPIAELCQITVLWLWIDLASNLIALAGTSLDLSLLMRMSDPLTIDPRTEIPGFDQLASVSVFTSWTPLVTFLIVGPIILRWIYRAGINAHAFARGLEISPGWAVGWYFVPIAALWKPYQAMSEIWRASHSPDGWKAAFAPPLLSEWWAFWLIGNIIGNIAGRMGLFGPVTHVSLTIGDVLVIISLALACAANLALMRVVKSVSRAQGERIAEGWGRREDPPAPEQPTADPAPA